MNSMFILGVVVAVYACYVDGHPQQSCSNGSCISLSECPHLKTLDDKKNKTPQEAELLQKSQCDSRENTTKVCCPDPCYNPDGKLGKCVNIYECAHLADMLKKPLSRPDNTVYVQNSKCLGPDHLSVCCGPPRELTYNQNTKCTGYLTASPPDPKSKCCGHDSSSGNRIQGGNATAIDQFTWLAMIEYSKNGGPIIVMCGASLISGRYVLTAAHCVTGDILSFGTPKNVRLAEYDTSTPGMDCSKESGGGYDCNDGTVTIRIEKSIPHPEYNIDDEQRRHDIALIRLQQSAPFTDFIRPICLPTVDRSINPPKEFSFFVAGWGAVSQNQLYSSIKLFVDLPFVPADKCQMGYSSSGGIQLWQGQLCAGGELGKDSCRGDSGGPLMYEDPITKAFEIIGVVSFGSTLCGFPDVPGVYTKVFAYKDWILSQIKP